jgi:hypothetical protein
VSKRTRKRLVPRLVVGGFIVALAVGVSASGARRGGAAASARPQPGMRVYIDPQTGQLREPTAEEAAALTAAIEADRGIAAMDEPQAITGTGGVVGVRLNASSESYSLATRNADGTIAMACVTGEKTAQTVVRHGNGDKEHVNDR